MKTKESDSLRWEDIVFESRNKGYGAYVIRSIYGKHIIIASLITVFITGLALGYPRIVEFFSDYEDEVATTQKTIKYNELAAPPPLTETPPPPKMEIPPPIKTIIKFLPPKVTEKEVADEEEMPTQEEIKQNTVGAETVEGAGIEWEEPVAEIFKDEGDDDVIFTVVEQQAEFPGGIEAMMKFLVKNMKYPAIARRMNTEGTVFVSFVVDKEGSISDLQVIKGISNECDHEALRVVKLMPQWKPGKQNGRAVRSRFVLPIKFKLAV